MTIQCPTCGHPFESSPDCPADRCWRCQRDALRESYPDLFPERREEEAGSEFVGGEGI